MKKIIFIIGITVVWIITALITTYNVFSGGMAFWFDPARDMLSAWDNLSKITLIGQPSGIPGIFYGPYWIWYLSLGEIFSKDPRVVLFLTTAIPYLIIFPLLLFSLSRMFGKMVTLLLWLFFFFGFQGYMTALWNPNLAPLLFLASICLTLFSLHVENAKKYFYLFLAGVVSGLAFNIHISFSSGFIFGLIIFLLIQNFIFKREEGINKNTRNTLRNLALYVGGFAIVFWPFILFEARHGFSQTKTALNALSKGGGVVALHGLSRVEILSAFFGQFAKLLSVPLFISPLLLVGAIVLLIVLFLKNTIFLTHDEKRLLLLLTTISGGVLTIYLSAKNPVWDYHFVGTEIIFLLFLGFILSKIKFFQYAAIVWVLVLGFLNIQNTVKSFSFNPLSQNTLYTKEYEVSLITKDAKGQSYSVFPYNAAIYNYDYSYLFRWKVGKIFSYDPGMVKKEGIVYLILPSATKIVRDNFTNFITPGNQYATSRTWSIPDGTIILKRVVKS